MCHSLFIYLTFYLSIYLSIYTQLSSRPFFWNVERIFPQRWRILHGEGQSATIGTVLQWWSRQCWSLEQMPRWQEAQGKFGLYYWRRIPLSAPSDRCIQVFIRARIKKRRWQCFEKDIYIYAPFLIYLFSLSQKGIIVVLTIAINNLWCLRYWFSIIDLFIYLFF